MEHKIGEIITLPDGMKAKVVEGNCDDCIFRIPHSDYCKVPREWECLRTARTDHKNIIYKEIKEE